MKKHLPLVFVPLAIAWIACTLNVQQRLNAARSHSHVYVQNVQFK